MASKLARAIKLATSICLHRSSFSVRSVVPCHCNLEEGLMGDRGGLLLISWINEVFELMLPFDRMITLDVTGMRGEWEVTPPMSLGRTTALTTCRYCTDGSCRLLPLAAIDISSIIVGRDIAATTQKLTWSFKTARFVYRPPLMLVVCSWCCVFLVYIAITPVANC